MAIAWANMAASSHFSCSRRRLSSGEGERTLLLLWGGPLGGPRPLRWDPPSSSSSSSPPSLGTDGGNPTLAAVSCCPTPLPSAAAACPREVFSYRSRGVVVVAVGAAACWICKSGGSCTLGLGVSGGPGGIYLPLQTGPRLLVSGLLVPGGGTTVGP